MAKVVIENNLKVRSYSFYKTLYNKFLCIKAIKHRVFNKEYESYLLRELSLRRGILIMIDGTPHDWFQNGKKYSLYTYSCFLKNPFLVIGLLYDISGVWPFDIIFLHIAGIR